ncbi:MAG: M20 family metallopeptidase [Candidatus Lokiarchaeota archaeon]|nr:M20 family metallopeptidase [Candidatus Lokiarchaeota archaeon]
MTRDIDVAKLATDLVAIPSDPPRNPETGVARFLKALFEQHGCPCVEIPSGLGKGRHDLLVSSHHIPRGDAATPPGPWRPGDGLLFSAHMDVVPPGDPAAWDGGKLDPWIDAGGFLHGRGAVDMKGGMAAFIAAFLDNLDAITRTKTALIGLLFTVDEETSLAGARAFARSRHAAWFGKAILPEPTGLQPVRGHKGVAFMRFTVTGKAAHGAVPDQGVNAITIAMEMYKAIDAAFLATRASRTHHVLGMPTMNLGTFSGGEKVNVVPSTCSFALDRRITPLETPEQVVAGIEAVAMQHPLPPGASASHEVINARPPYYLDDGHPFLREIVALAGRPPATMNGYTEAGIFHGDARIPTIILGPGTIDEAHVANEKVAVSDLAAAEKIYARIMMDHLDTHGRAGGKP